MKKETLQKEYIEKGLTQKQIAEKYNVSRTTVIRNMQKFEIPSRPKHKNPEKVLTLKEEEFIFGKVLGDGSIYKGTSSLNCRLGFAHTSSQKEYVDYCYSFIKDWCNNPPVYREQKRDPKIYKNPVIKKYVLETISHPEFSRLRRYFYEYDRKIINKDILSNITPLSLAIWYQDDGSLEVDSRTKIATGMKLHTNQFPIYSVNLICDWLKTTYDINCNVNKSQIGKDGNSQYCVRISKKSIKDFSDLISPFVVNSMKYKII